MGRPVEREIRGVECSRSERNGDGSEVGGRHSMVLRHMVSEPGAEGVSSLASCLGDFPGTRAKTECALFVLSRYLASFAANSEKARGRNTRVIGGRFGDDSLGGGKRRGRVHVVPLHLMTGTRNWDGDVDGVGCLRCVRASCALRARTALLCTLVVKTG
ncbi:hypothetical protein LZ32DRAFT_10880 [Colletotrichum eremochloae]|nr:hypothetical protein LZ32DRAFT_10880 [Colletotrichum eremochloae]